VDKSSAYHPSRFEFSFSIFVFIFLVNQLRDVIGKSISTGTRKKFISSIIGRDTPSLPHYCPLLLHYPSTVPPLSPSVKPFPVESFCLFAPETSVSASGPVDGSILEKPWTLTGGFMWNFSSC
jgi:hypothetical protein